MQQEQDNTNEIAEAASDLVGRVLSIPLIWPKTTVLVSVALIALGMAMVALSGRSSHRSPPPPLNDQRLAEMMEAVRRADERVRKQAGMLFQPVPEAQGVFETMRNSPPIQESSP